MTEHEQLIADQAELETFIRLPSEQRQVTDRLRGVLAETAVTGVIRYPWPLVQPLLVQVMQQQLSKYEAEEHVEIGPARPILGGSDDSVDKLVERFSKLLGAFDSHPWTLQRLCELALEPQKQYKRLHKLALAIEKLLLVTGELHTTEQPGPPPALSSLTRVNEALPQSAAAQAASNPGSRQGEMNESGLVAAALDIRQTPQQTSEGTAAAAAAAAGGEPAPDPMQVDVVAPSAGAAPAAAAAADAAASTAALASSDAADMEQEAVPGTQAAGGGSVGAAAASGSGAGAGSGATAAAGEAVSGDVEMSAEEAPAAPLGHSHTNAAGHRPEPAGGAVAT